MKIVRLTENDLRKIVKKTIIESKYSSVAKILRGGIRKSIKTIAILTAENPYGKEASKDYNREANDELEVFLTSGRFGYRKIKGSYGSRENSFIVNNISLSTAIQIGEKFKQDSIVFGEVVEGEPDGVYMTFSMVGTDPKKPDEYRNAIAENDVFINRNDADDFFSEVGGKKFVIPFYGTIDRLKDENDKFFDLEKDYSKTKWEGGKAIPTSTNITPSEEDLNELNDLQENAIRTDGSSAYNYRARIQQILKKLNLTNL
jgi:hypothetical protein